MGQQFNLSPFDSPVDKAGEALSKEWFVFFNQVASATNSLYNSGTTAQRPTQNVYLGQLYFDTTLGALIFVRQVTPTVLWARITSTNL